MHSTLHYFDTVPESVALFGYRLSPLSAICTGPDWVPLRWACPVRLGSACDRARAGSGLLEVADYCVRSERVNLVNGSIKQFLSVSVNQRSN